MSETRALSVIPQGASLVDREPQVVAWVDEQTDAQLLREARALLSAWKRHSERGSAERDAAIRLDIRCERRLGQLPEAAPKPQGGDRRRSASQPVTQVPGAERMALSRARALAAIPQDVFEEKLAEPKPSREKLVAVAIVPEPTVDPVAEESARIHRNLKGPSKDSWPTAFDPSMLNEKAVLTIRETQESWRRWCDRWDEALASVPQMRRVK
jgi:hypothetical protein